MTETQPARRATPAAGAPIPAWAAASTARMLARGSIRRCPRCGSGRLYHRWFHLAARCPGCGYPFAREEGFFLGAFVVNLGVTIAGLAVLMGVLIALLANHGAPGAIVVVAMAAAAEAVVVPVLFYPFSKTLWAAIDLAMHRGERWAASGDAATAPPTR